jgi:hypothetical protein
MVSLVFQLDEGVKSYMQSKLRHDTLQALKKFF